jgi:hypothetical protein
MAYKDDPCYFRKKFRAYHDKLRKLVIEKLGGKCVRCGFSDYRALQIDHVHGGGRKEAKAITNRKKFLLKVLLDEEGVYQLLCANCNWIKRCENLETGRIVTDTKTVEGGLPTTIPVESVV